jgi:hypothetical protein
LLNEPSGSSQFDFALPRGRSTSGIECARVRSRLYSPYAVQVLGMSELDAARFTAATTYGVTRWGQRPLVRVVDRQPVSSRCASRVRSGIGTPTGQLPRQGALHPAQTDALVRSCA